MADATGVPIDPGNLSYWQQQFAAGQNLAVLESALSVYGPTVSAIKDIYQQVSGSSNIPSPLLTEIQTEMSENSNGLTGDISLILSDPAAQQSIINNNSMVLQVPLSSQQIQEEQVALAAIPNNTVGLTLATIAANLTDNLINFLNPIASAEAATLPTKPVDTSSPLQSLTTNQIPSFSIPAGDYVVFVGGAFDQTVSGIVEQEYQAYEGNHPLTSAYFTYNQGSQLAAFIQATGGHVVVIGHSYGGDTAATAVANSAVKVDALITLDPVSLFTPSYAKVAANTSQWLDFNATGGSALNTNNVISGLGGDWGQPVAKFATYFANVTDQDHGSIGGRAFITHLIGN